MEIEMASTSAASTSKERKKSCKSKRTERMNETKQHHFFHLKVHDTVGLGGFNPSYMSLVFGRGKESDGKQCSIRSNKSNKSAVEHIVVYLPAKFPSCPPGLEKLIPVTHLFVRQGIRQLEPPYEMINKKKYEVLDGDGRRVFLARDSTDNILKLCCRGGCGQPFRMSIKEKNSGYEILAVIARPDCYGAMSACISQNGMNLGFLTEEWRCCSSNYIVIDAQGSEIFRIIDKGSKFLAELEKAKRLAKSAPAPTPSDSTPSCFCGCRRALGCNPTAGGLRACLDSAVSLISGGVEFELYSTAAGAIVGRMTKQWEELYDQHFNLVDCLGVNFPAELSVRHKALVLGALFLLDFNHNQI